MTVRPERRVSYRAAAASRGDSAKPNIHKRSSCPACPGHPRSSDQWLDVVGPDKPGQDGVKIGPQLSGARGQLYAARTPARNVPTSPESCSACLDRFEAAAST